MLRKKGINAWRNQMKCVFLQWRGLYAVRLHSNKDFTNQTIYYMLILKIYLLDAPVQLIGLVVVSVLCLIYYGIKALVERRSLNKWEREQQAKKMALMETLTEYVEPYSDVYGGYRYVDLGLPSGTLWATCNIGASNPGGLGFYFEWGATSPSNYVYKNKKTYNVPYLDPAHDAANTNWGGAWRIPTKREFDELIDYCTWVAEKCSNVMGYKVVGPNQNSIFIPLASYYGIYDRKPRSVNEDASYWTCQQTDNLSRIDEAFALLLNDEGSRRTHQIWKLVLHPIRPVFSR